MASISVADPHPDPPDPHVFGLLDPDPDPLIRGMDPDPLVRYGSGSGSGSFYQQAKLVRKP